MSEIYRAQRLDSEHIILWCALILRRLSFGSHTLILHSASMPNFWKWLLFGTLFTICMTIAFLRFYPRRHRSGPVPDMTPEAHVDPDSPPEYESRPLGARFSRSDCPSEDDELRQPEQAHLQPFWDTAGEGIGGDNVMDGSGLGRGPSQQLGRPGRRLSEDPTRRAVVLWPFY